MIILEPEKLIDSVGASSLAEEYFNALLEENAVVNLVSRETSREDLRKLYAESILPIVHWGISPERYLDIGSGGGFPAIPILSLLGIAGTFVERTKKKGAALGRMTKRLGLNANVLSIDAAELPAGEMFDLITIRYVRLTDELLHLLLKHLDRSGSLIYYSAQVDEETAKEALVSRETVNYRLAQDDVNRGFTRFRKLS